MEQSIDASKKEQCSDASKRDDFVWTDMAVITLCDFLNKYIERNGRTAPFKWIELQPQFETIVKHKFQSDKALKNKHSAMRQDYNLWKSLKHGETGLGWNESTGRIEGDTEWWANKIKENPNLKRFMKKQPSKEVQDAWDLLYGDVVASGVNCVAPSVDPNTSNDMPCMNLIDDDIEVDNDEDTYQVYTRYASRLDDLEKQQNEFYPSLVTEMHQDPVSNPNHIGSSKGPHKSTKVNEKSKHVKTKRKLRESPGAVKFKEFMTKQETTEEKILELLMSDTRNFNAAPSDNDQAPHVNQASNFSVNATISVINGMVNCGLMAKDELWCFAISLFEDAVIREIFMSLPDDASRLQWLQYKHEHGN